jgi:hypothetical protein
MSGHWVAETKQFMQGLLDDRAKLIIKLGQIQARIDEIDDAIRGAEGLIEVHDTALRDRTNQG